MRKLKIYDKYRHNNNAKRLIANFVSLSSLQVIGYIFPLITLPYLANVIGVKGFGYIAFATAVISYFSTVTDWGFRYTAVRAIAQKRDNKETVSLIFSQVILSKTILMLVSAVTLFVLIEVIPLFRENSLILWCAFAMIPGYIIFPDWLFQAMEEMKFITIMNIMSKTLFMILIFIFIRHPEDYVFEPIIQAGGYVVSGIIGLIYALKHFKLRFYFPPMKSVFIVMRSSCNMFISQFFPTLYNNLSVIVLEAISGTNANGLFSAGNKFITIMDQVTQSLSRTFYPFLARRMDKHSVYVRISGGISVCMSVFLFFTADVLIKIFYTSEFESAATIIRIMSCSPFFLFLMNSFGTNGLALIGKDNILRNIVVGCSVFGMLFSIMGIIMWSYYGVAIAITVTWGIRGLLSYINFKNYLS